MTELLVRLHERVVVVLVKNHGPPAVVCQTLADLHNSGGKNDRSGIRDCFTRSDTRAERTRARLTSTPEDDGLIGFNA